MKRKLLVSVISIPVLVLIGLLLFAEWAWGGSIKPSLDAQYVPTAEYLLQYPQPKLSFLRVYPEPGAIVSFSDQEDTVSVRVEGKPSISILTQLFLNTQRLPHDKLGISRDNILNLPVDENSDSIVFIFYTKSRLNSGLHLFRIQIVSSFGEFLNPDPNLSYEWAYRVE